MTLPLIYSLKKVQEPGSREIVRHLKESSEESFNLIYNFVNENGGIEYAYKKADELCQQGLDQISTTDGSIYYESLESMVKYTIARAS